MTAALVSLGVFVTMLVAVVVFVSRHESERHFATGMAASRHMPNSI